MNPSNGENVQQPLRSICCHLPARMENYGNTGESNGVTSGKPKSILQVIRMQILRAEGPKQREWSVYRESMKVVFPQLGQKAKRKNSLQFLNFSVVSLKFGIILELI